jgi:hypothetical protein
LINIIHKRFFLKIYQIQKRKHQPGAVAEACYPRSSGHGDQKDWALKTAQERVQETSSQPIQAGHGGAHCHPNYVGSLSRRIIVWASPGINVRPYSKNS